MPPQLPRRSAEPVPEPAECFADVGKIKYQCRLCGAGAEDSHLASRKHLDKVAKYQQYLASQAVQGSDAVFGAYIRTQLRPCNRRKSTRTPSPLHCQPLPQSPFVWRPPPPPPAPPEIQRRSSTKASKGVCLNRTFAEMKQWQKWQNFVGQLRSQQHSNRLHEAAVQILLEDHCSCPAGMRSSLLPNPRAHHV